MKKLATMPMDIVDELLQEDLDSLLELVDDLPESVKTAHIPTTAEVDTMDENNFALVMYHPEFGFMKKFANHNADITTLNTKLFMKKEALLPEELCTIAGKNLYRAHIQFNMALPDGLGKYAVDDYVNNVIEINSVNRIAYSNKLEVVEEPTEKIAYALPIDERFPIHDKHHIKRAIDFFSENSIVLDIPARIVYASNIVAASEEATDQIKKYANLATDEFNEEFEVHLDSRRRLLKEENKKYIDGLATKVADLNPMQACLYLEEIDTTFGLDKSYGKYIEDAPISTFGVIKEASVELADGSWLNTSTLDTILSNEKTAECVSEDLLAALNSGDGLKVFSMMPSDLQDILKGLE